MRSTVTPRAYRAHVLHTPTPEAFEVVEHGYVVVEEGRVRSLGPELPEDRRDVEVHDLGDRLLIPAFVDLHVHAPQLPMAGVGLGEELLPWLEHHTFPLEARYADPAFARLAYQRFLTAMWEVGTLRFSAFATVHTEATLALMALCRESGLRALIGKVAMDRHAPEPLLESAEESLRGTIEIIERSCELGPEVRPIITPRFVPSVSSTLMRRLGELAEEHDLPVQSHLSENLEEIAWARRLHPEAGSYAEVYAEHGLLRPGRTIMAHCVHLTTAEQDLLHERDVTLAHCAQSNADLTSGIMPVRRHLERGLRCVIASDVAGGHSLAMNRHVVASVETSKTWRTLHPEDPPLTLAEAFHMATRAPGAFLGDVGSFEPGHEFDALVVDMPAGPLGHSPLERLEQFVHTGDDRAITHRFVAGAEVPRPFS